jgi:hypothetical protein
MIFLNLMDIGRQIRVPIVAPGQMSACNTSEIWPPLASELGGGERLPNDTRPCPIGTGIRHNQGAYF